MHHDTKVLSNTLSRNTCTKSTISMCYSYRYTITGGLLFEKKKKRHSLRSNKNRRKTFISIELKIFNLNENIFPFIFSNIESRMENHEYSDVQFFRCRMVRKMTGMFFFFFQFHKVKINGRTKYYIRAIEISNETNQEFRKVTMCSLPYACCAN